MRFVQRKRIYECLKSMNECNLGENNVWSLCRRMKPSGFRTYAFYTEFVNTTLNLKQGEFSEQIANKKVALFIVLKVGI